MIRRVHLIESGGQGGVFNHTVEVAVGLRALGVDAVLHTATDHDDAPSNLLMCKCIRWHRRSASRRIRQVRTTARYLGRTLPHLWRVIGRDDVVHVQGAFALTPELITVARMRGATVVCSPHNTFARAGAPGTSRTLASVFHRADRVLVYSQADAARLESIRPPVAQLPLVQWTPSVKPDLVAKWRDELNPHGARLALMPGQVRADKNPDRFARAIAMMDGWCGAVVGQDLGAGAALDDLIAQLQAPVQTRYGYVDVDDFVAMVAAADVVVAPYEVASQSGVVAVAAKLGVPTAVAPVGGLRELGTVVARDNTPGSIMEAINAAAGHPRPTLLDPDASKLFLAEYEAAHEGRVARSERRT